MPYSDISKDLREVEKTRKAFDCSMALCHLSDSNITCQGWKVINLKNTNRIGRKIVLLFFLTGSLLWRSALMAMRNVTGVLRGSLAIQGSGRMTMMCSNTSTDFLFDCIGACRTQGLASLVCRKKNSEIFVKNQTNCKSRAVSRSRAFRL